MDPSACQHAKALPVRRFGLGSIQRRELERRRIILASHEGGRELERVRRAERMRFDESLRVVTHEIGRRHFGPALPRAENLPPRAKAFFM